ncbi:MAG: hypothetical protein EOM08_04040 [Clostridia bacterium]|nr:hypothetical protein [Clostridia bacterium]
MSAKAAKTPRQASQQPGQSVPDSMPELDATQTTMGLIRLMLVSAFKNVPKMLKGMLIQGAFAFLFVFFINFYAMAIKNEGFGMSLPADSPWYPLLNIGDNQAAFSALSFLFMFVLSTLWGRIRGRGVKQFFKEIFSVPGWTAQSLRETGRFSLPVLAVSSGLMLFTSLLIQNRYLYVTFAIGLFFAYAAGNADFSMLLFRAIWSDLQRLFRRGRPVQPAHTGSIALTMLGFMVGSILLFYLPRQPILPMVLGALLVIVGILLFRRKITPQTAVFILGLATVYALLSELDIRVFADDGGWQEGGGTLSSYARSPGAADVVKTGVQPGILGTMGSMLGSIFSTGYNAAASAAGAAVDAGKYVGGKVVDGAKYVGGKVVDGAKYVAETAVNTGKEVVQIGRDLLNPDIIKDTVANIKNELVDTAKIIKDGVVTIASEVKQAAVDVYNDPQILVDTIKGTAGDIKDGVVTVVTETAQAVKDIYNNPELILDTLKGSAETVKNVVTNVASAIYTTVTDPEKAWEFVKDAVGVKDFQNSWDPNKPLITRIGSVLTGTIKLGTTIATAGQAGAAIKSGVKAAGSFVDDIGRIVGTGVKKSGSLVDDVAKAAAGTKKIVKGVPGKLPVKPGAGYTTSTKPVKLGGITDKSAKAIQNVADDMGVQIHTRPVTGKAKDLLESGKALPKPMEIKAKTLNKIDELIGGPQGREGAVGIFQPKKPPENIMNKLSKEVREQIEERFEKRAKEYTKYIDELKSNKNVEIIDNIIYDKKTGKVFTGDVDIYDITSFDGSPLPEKIKQQVWKKLESIGPSNVKHGNLTSWNPSDPHFDPKAFEGMINDGKQTFINTEGKLVNGSGVTSFNPLNNPTHSFAN